MASGAPIPFIVSPSIVISMMYVPMVYVTNEFFYFFWTRSGAVKIVGMFASFICAFVSLTPTPLIMHLFEISCRLIQLETISKENLIEIKNQAYMVNYHFKDLSKAWSPMIAVTFATECLILISAGFAFQFVFTMNPVVYEYGDYVNYLFLRNIMMIFMLIYCITFILCISWYAELTHTCVKEFGSRVR